MSDIFISYASADRDPARMLRAAAKDLRTGERIGSYDVPVTIVRPGPAD